MKISKVIPAVLTFFGLALLNGENNQDSALHSPSKKNAIVTLISGKFT